MSSSPEFTPMTPEERDFEVAHAQGNGRMALEAAGIKPVQPDEPTSQMPNFRDFEDFTQFGEAMEKWAKDNPVSLPPPSKPKQFHPSSKPFGWRDRRRA